MHLNIYPDTLEKNMRSKNSPPKPEISTRAVTLWINLAQILCVVWRFIGNWARGIHFWGQNKYWSILTGALVAGSFIMSHLTTDFKSKIFSFIARASGYLRLWRWVFWAHIFFKSIRINVQVQLMKLRLIYCQKI